MEISITKFAPEFRIVLCLLNNTCLIEYSTSIILSQENFQLLTANTTIISWNQLIPWTKICSLYHKNDAAAVIHNIWLIAFNDMKIAANDYFHVINGSMDRFLARIQLRSNSAGKNRPNEILSENLLGNLKSIFISKKGFHYRNCS